MEPINVNNTTQLKVAPRIDEQLIGLDDDCLVIQHFNANLLIAMGWGGCLFFWLVGLPMILFFIIDPWLPPYGSRNGVEITSFYESIISTSLAELAVLFFFGIGVLGGFMVAMTLGFSYLNLRAIKKLYSPITFNRKTGMVSIYHDDEKDERPWSKLSGTIETARYASGFVVHHSDVLRLHALGKQTQISGGFFVDGLDDEKHVGAEAVWEFIRQFMENGPNDLPITAISPKSLNQIDKQPMFSFNFKESLKVHWISALINKKSADVADWIIAAIVVPIKIIFFIPNIMADWLWRKLCLRMLKTSKVTPQYSLNNCKNPITTSDSEKVLKDEGENPLIGLSYKEIRRRLNELT